MWFFRSPEIVFGEDAHTWLAQLKGQRAFIVTDANIQALGLLQLVQEQLASAGMQSECFAEVEPDPALETVQRAAEQMLSFEPDVVIGLGGGSSLDAAKAAWFLYERPDVPLEAVSPLEEFGLGKKARFVTIPTTAGSGSEVTAAAVLTLAAEQRKIEVASFELISGLAVIDPRFSAQMPASLTADTGIDVLTHAVEGYSTTWANDFSDGMCLQAARMVFEYLPRAVAQGETDMEAREKMANAAAIAGLGMTNSHIGMAHALGHALGAAFHLPHGRVTGMALPYSIEFVAWEGGGRYLELARLIGLCADSEAEAGPLLAGAVRELMQQVGLPVSLEQAGLAPDALEAELDGLCSRAEIDVAMITSRRIPDREQLERIFRYMQAGRSIDF